MGGSSKYGSSAAAVSPWSPGSVQLPIMFCVSGVILFTTELLCARGPAALLMRCLTHWARPAVTFNYPSLGSPILAQPEQPLLPLQPSIVGRKSIHIRISKQRRMNAWGGQLHVLPHRSPALLRHFPSAFERPHPFKVSISLRMGNWNFKFKLSAFDSVRWHRARIGRCVSAGSLTSQHSRAAVLELCSIYFPLYLSASFLTADGKLLIWFCIQHALDMQQTL